MKILLSIFLILNSINVILSQNEPFEHRVADRINTGVNYAADGITHLRDGFSDFGEATKDKFVGAAETVGNGFENLRDDAGEWFSNVGNRVTDWWNNAGNTAHNIGHGVKEGVVHTGEAIGGGFRYIYDGAGNIIGRTEDAVGRRLQTAGERLQNNENYNN